MKKDKRNRPNSTERRRLRIRLAFNGCQICGWNKAPCDVHRIVSGAEGGKYTTDNCMVLCPNCHRLKHRGLI